LVNFKTSNPFGLKFKSLIQQNLIYYIFNKHCVIIYFLISNGLIMKFVLGLLTCWASPALPSSTSTELKVLSLTKRYRKRGFPNFGRVKIDGEARNTFRFWKASSHSLVQWNSSHFLNVVKKWNVLSTRSDRKRHMIVILPINSCTSFSVVGRNWILEFAWLSSNL